MSKQNFLNTDCTTFLISFSWKPTNGKFIFQDGKDLIFLLNTYGEKGIDYIKEFDPAKATFKRTSKKRVLQFFNWETETIQYLKNHFYFKS